MKVKVVAYKERLVIVPNNPTEDIGKPVGWYPTGDGRMGCVLTDTKARLGVSEEAFELMKKIPRNRDAIGDIGWWECDDKTWAFSWFGSIHRIINPIKSEGDRNFRVNDTLKQFCTIIPNDVPEEAKAILDNLPDGYEAYQWNELYNLDNVTLQGHEDDQNDDADDNHCGCGDEHCH